MFKSRFSRWIRYFAGLDRVQRPQPRRARPMLEALEERLAPAVRTWDGGAVNDDRWSTAANWANDTLPGTGDDVVIASTPDSAEVFFDSTVSINSLTSDGMNPVSEPFRIPFGTLTLNGPGTFSLGDTLMMTGGVINGNGTFTIGGPFTWSGGTIGGSGTVDVNGGLTANGSTKTLDGRRMNLNSTTTWSAGQWSLFNNAVLANSAGQTFSMQTDLFLDDGTNAEGLGEQFINNGTFQKTGGAGTGTIETQFTNNGTVRAVSGRLSSTGTFTNYDAATRTLTGGTYFVGATFSASNFLPGTNAASIVLDGAAAQILNNTTGTSALAGLNINAAAGNFTIQNGANLLVPVIGSVIGTFNPATLGGIIGIALDPVSGNVFVHASSTTTITEFTPAGMQVNSIPRPGAPSNSFDLDFLPEAITVGAVNVPANSLIVINGDDSPESVRYLDKTSGAVLASVSIAAGSGADGTVGGSYHLQRHSIFIVDFSNDRIREINPTTGAEIAFFPVAPGGSPAFDAFFADVEVNQTTGNLIIVSSNATRIREMTPTGAFVRDVDVTALGLGGLSGIAFNDAAEETWITNINGDVFRLSAPVYANAGNVTVSNGSLFILGGSSDYTQTAGTTALADGSFGSPAGLNFNGSNNFVTVPSSASLNPTTQVTIEAWIKPNTSNNSQNGIAGTWSDLENPYTYLLWTLSNRASFYIAHPGGIFASTVGTTVLQAGQWYHVTGTFDGTNIRLYVNGILEATTLSPGAIATNTQPFLIGRQNAGGAGPTFFNGAIGDVRLWNTALSQAAIQANQGKVLTGTETGLVANWLLNEGTGTSARDQTSNQNTGTLVNSPTWVSPAAVSLQGGILTGSGTALADVTNGALFSPGTSPGIVVLGGDYTQTAAGTLSIEINGANAATPDFDQLYVNGTVTLAGSLNVTLPTGFMAAFNSTFKIIDNDGADVVSGTFAGLAEGAGFTVGSSAFFISYVGGTGNDVVLTSVPNTTLELVGANLVITDFADGITNDTLTIVRSGGNLRVTDPNSRLGALAGTTQVDAFTVEVPFASVTGNIQVVTLGGNDTLTVDFSGGNPIPAGGIAYAGGTGTTDVLAVTGGTTTTVTHTFTSANDGSVTLAGALAGTISYAGLEPVTDNLSAADRIFTFTGGAETITLSDAAGANMLIDSTLGESVTFANPSASLTINAGTGADTVTIASVDLNGPFNAALTINGGTGDDTVNLNADINFAAGNSLDVDLQNDDATPGADSINVASSANLNLLGAGTASLVASRNIRMFSGSSITTVSGGITLTANQQATPTASNFIGIHLDNAIVTSTTGNVTLQGKGGDSGNDNHGVQIRNAGIVQTTGSGAVSVQGDGGVTPGGFFNFGVRIIDAGTQITSGGGNVSVTGQGGTSFFGSDFGVGIDSGAVVTAGGTGSVTVMGTGGAGSGGVNHGILIRDANSQVTSAGGAVSVTGTAGAGATSFAVQADGAGRITSGSNAPITVTADSVNIVTGGTINSGSGTTTIRQRTPGTSIDLGGVDVLSSPLTLGLTAAELNQITAGTLVIGRNDIASGGVTVSAIVGPTGATALSVITARNIIVNANLTAGSGGLSLSANQQMTSTAEDFTGVTVQSGAVVTATGIGAVSVTGTGGSGSGSGNIGVSVNGLGATITSGGAGTVTVTGTGSSGSGGGNYGVYVLNSGQVTSGGAGTVTVMGTGGSGSSDSNLGVYVLDSGQITSGGGNVSVTGQGGGGSGFGSLGVFVLDSSQITSGGSGTVTVMGTGGSGSGNNHYGVYVNGLGATIASGGSGMVTVMGTGGSGSGVVNIGVYVNSSGQIISGGGAVSITGTGTGTANSEAVRLQADGAITSGSNAPITITADSVNIITGGTINSGSGTTTLVQRTPGTLIDLGGADVLTGSPLTLGLTDVELDRVAAGTVAIGDANSGAITISAVISPANYKTLDIQKGVAFTASGGFDSDVTSATVFEKIQANGAVAIDTSATLTVTAIGGFVPAAADSFTLINNTSGTTTTGNFSGKTEGTVVPVGGVNKQITYAGGGGANNDVVLIPAAAGGPTVTLSLTGSPLAENGGVATVTATLSAVSGLDVTVDLGFTGTATNPDDYTRSATSIVITAGNTTGSVTLTGANDALDEAAETIIVDITGVTNGTESGAQQVTATITDDEPTPTVTLSQAGSPLSENGGVATVTATLSAASGLDVTVDLGFTGTATNPDDYTRSATSIVITAGNTTGSIALTGVNDAFDDSGETIIVDIIGVTNGTESGVQQVTATISPEAGVPTVTLSVDTPTITEATSGAATVTAAVSQTSAQDVTVNLGFSGSTAGADFTASDTQIVITAGNLSGSITLTAQNDTIVEGNETIVVDVTSVINGTENGTQQRTVIVTDNDTAAITFSSPTSAAAEGGVDASVGVTLTITANGTPNTGTLGAAVTVELLGAGSSVDYTLPASPMVSFASGASSGSQNVTVAAVNDLMVEGTEAFNLDFTNLSDPTGQVSTSGSYMLSITDNDTAAITFSSPTSAATEGGVDASVGVTLTITANGMMGTGTLGAAVTVDLAGMASGVDYTLPASPMIRFSSGASSGSQNVTVAAVNDMMVEGTETFNLDFTNLSDPTGQINTSGSNLLSIIDNDNGGNVPPSAVEDMATTRPGTSVTIIVLANDSDTDGSLNPDTVTIMVPPSSGDVLVNSDGTITYTPSASLGNITFSYTVMDNLGAVSNAAIVSVVVDALPVINSPASAQTFRNAPLKFSRARLISISDQDANGRAETVIVEVGQGTLKLATTRDLTFEPGFGNRRPEIRMTGTLAALNTALAGLRYLPMANAAGMTSLEITVDDFGTPGGLQATALKTVDLSVFARLPVIVPPPLYQIPPNQLLSVPVSNGLLANSRSPDRAPLTVRLVGRAPAGLTLGRNGSFVYNPPFNFIGDVVFRFQVFDGIFLSDPITARIRVSFGGHGRW